MKGLLHSAGFICAKLHINVSGITLSALEYPLHLTSWGGIAGTWAQWPQAGKCSSCRWEAASIGGVRQCTGRACSLSASLAGSRPRRGGAEDPNMSAARPGWWELAPVPTPAAAGSWRASRPPHAPSRNPSHCDLKRSSQLCYILIYGMHFNVLNVASEQFNQQLKQRSIQLAKKPLNNIVTENGH